MKLGGQGQRGYAMATLLVGMAIMAIFMTVALPAWSQLAQREKEAEYLFRANQYALAIKRFNDKMQKGGNGPAPSVDYLVEQKFLRKKYKDPLSGKDFVPLLQNQAVPGQGISTGAAGQMQTQNNPNGQNNPNNRDGQGQQQQQQSSLATAAKSLAVDTLKVSATEGGSGSTTPLTGVTSASKETAIRLFKGQETTYDQWAVTAQDVGLHLGGYGVGTRWSANQGPGAQQQQQQQQPGAQPGQSPFGSQGQSPFGSQGQSPFGNSGTGMSGPGGFGSSGTGGFGTPGAQGNSVFPLSPFGGGQGTTPTVPTSPAPQPMPPPSSPFGGRKPLL